MRIKSKWSLKDRERTLSETGSTMAFILWRIAQQGVLNLENEGFQTDTNSQRLDVMGEFLGFLVHVTDRMTADRLDQHDRQEFITSLATHLANSMQENRTDAEGKGEYRQPLINLLNERASDYSECSFNNHEPGYAFRRCFGDCVRSMMGEKDNQWITDQVMNIEAPYALRPLLSAMRDLFPEGST